MATTTPQSDTAATAITLAHNLLIAALATLAGVALSLRYWVMPAIIGLASSADTLTTDSERRARRKHNTLLQIRQFDHVIDLGFRYLQPSSRLLPVVMIGLAAATYRYNAGNDHVTGVLKDAAHQARYQLPQDWTHYLLALYPLILIGPWEAYLIFPTNDRIAAIREELERNPEKSEGAVEAKQGEVQQLLVRWQTWHVGRIVGPYIALAVLAASGAGVLPRVRLW